MIQAFFPKKIFISRVFDLILDNFIEEYLYLKIYPTPKYFLLRKLIEEVILRYSTNFCVILRKFRGQPLALK